jgi:hypothetical protein
VVFRKRKAVPVIEAPAPGSLAEALAVVPDPRRPYGWRPGHEPIPLVALLQQTVVALLCGARSQSAVAQWGRERLEDDPELLAALGLPPGRSPCVATLHRLYKALDVAAFEAALGGWLGRIGSEPAMPGSTRVPEAVAIDGKVLRGSQPKREDEPDSVPGTYLVAAYAHASGVVLGQARAAGNGHELAAAKTPLQHVPIVGRVVTADALLTQRDIAEQIVADGGEYRFPIDDNQPALLADTEAALPPPWMQVDRQPDGLPTGVTVPPHWLRRELAERGGRLSWFLEATPKARHGRREVRLAWALADPEQNAYVGSSGTHATPGPTWGSSVASSAIACRSDAARSSPPSGRFATTSPVWHRSEPTPRHSWR